jgi:hypothetical protein
MQLQHDQSEQLLDLLDVMAKRLIHLAEDAGITANAVEHLRKDVKGGLEAVAAAIDRLATIMYERKKIKHGHERGASK